MQTANRWYNIAVWMSKFPLKYIVIIILAIIYYCYEACSLVDVPSNYFGPAAKHSNIALNF